MDLFLILLIEGFYSRCYGICFLLINKSEIFVDGPSFEFIHPSFDSFDSTSFAINELMGNERVYVEKNKEMDGVGSRPPKCRVLMGSKLIICPYCYLCILGEVYLLMD